MKLKPPDKAEQFRTHGDAGTNAGFFIFDNRSPALRVQISDGLGWDHVSVSTAIRCPTWDEMSFIKKLFFEPEEAVMQLHPRESEYVNFHQFCLHLWRPQSPDELMRVKSQWGDEWPEEYEAIESPGRIPEPPSFAVGPKKVQATP